MFQPKLLARNIRKYRLLHGLTQAQLAQRLFVTAQNISKWETGKSIPDLENLCMLSQTLCISTDRLLGHTETSSIGRVMVAVNGSNTRTEFVLFTEYGEVLARFFLHGSNPNFANLDNTRSVLRTGIERLLTINADICAVYASIAGCDNVDNQHALQNFLHELCPGIPCQVESDVLNSVYNTPVRDRCIVALCDTRSVVYVKTPALLQRIGGQDSLWASGCSDYDFGRDALLASLKTRNNLSESETLLQLVESAIGGDVRKKISELQKLPREEVSAYAKLVFDAYMLGDTTAIQIVEKNTQQLASLINTATQHYDCGMDVVLCGEIFSQKDILMHHLQPKLQPGLRLHINTLPQICRAAVKACALLDVETSEFKEAFHKNYLHFTKSSLNI